MQLPQSDIIIIKSEDMKESSFGISKGNEAHLLNIFRNKLYTDKPAAVIREYSTNATDGHCLNGNQDRPIEIHLPNALFPNFKVRDFGPGLVEEDIYNIYTQYGASTKRASNDFIGGLGIGCKAAFCYTDVFGIVSITRGDRLNIKKTYSAYIDETQIGKVALLQTAFTEEETGIEITVPVKKDDYNIFRTTAQKVFQYFRVKPKIVNAENVITAEEIVTSGKDWYFVKNDYRNDFVVIMGDIGYKINQNLLLDSLKLEKDEHTLFRGIIKSGFRLRFNIGELNIAANREDLEYDPTTLSKIKQKILSIVKDIEEIINEKVAKANSLLEAKFIRKELIAQFFYLNLKSKWNGIIIQENLLFEVPIGIAFYGLYGNNKSYKPYYYKDEPGSKSVDINDTYLFKEFKDITLYKKGTETKQWKKKFSLDKKINEVRICFEIINKGAWEEFSKTYRLDKENIIDLDKVEIPKEERERLKIENKKHQLKCFEYVYNKDANSNSDHFKEIDLEFDKEIVYMNLYCFKWKDAEKGIDYDPSEIKRIVSSLEEFGMPIPKLYGIKSGYSGSREKMVSFDIVINKFMKEIIEKENVIQDVRSKRYISGFQYSDMSFYENNVDKIKDKDSLFGKYIKDYINAKESVKKIDKAKESLISKKYRMYLDFNKKAPPEEDLNHYAVIKRLEVKYPMLKIGEIINPSANYRQTAENMKNNIDHIIEYINYIDLKEEK